MPFEGTRVSFLLFTHSSLPQLSNQMSRLVEMGLNPPAIDQQVVSVVQPTNRPLFNPSVANNGSEVGVKTNLDTEVHQLEDGSWLMDPPSKWNCFLGGDPNSPSRTWAEAKKKMTVNPISGRVTSTDTKVDPVREIVHTDNLDDVRYSNVIVMIADQHGVAPTDSNYMVSDMFPYVHLWNNRRILPNSSIKNE